jgi:Protein of unknown function (DUF3019)
MTFRGPLWPLTSLTCGLCLLGITGLGVSFASSDDDMHLVIRPRVCTLGPNEQRCETPVQASWKASHAESLCLIVLERADVKRCWEHFDSGTYTVQLTFSDDLTFQLRDPQLREGRGGAGFSDTGISGLLAGHDRRNEVHEEAQT